MRNFFKSLNADTEGGVLIYTAILLPVFLGFMALGLDIAAWHIEKRQSQTMADAAAVAAAIEDFKITAQGGTSPGCAAGDVFDAASDAAGLNNFDAAIGHTLTLNCPSSQGASVGVAGSVEAIVTTPLPLFLASVINVSVEGASAYSRAVAGAELGDACIFGLNPSERSTVEVSGGSTLTLNCGVRANSSHDEAIKLNGTGSCITATEILSVGGISGSGGGPPCFSPPGTERVNAAEDPLAGLPEPDATGVCTNGGVTTGGQSPIRPSDGDVLTAGRYCRDVFINDSSATVTFAPGIHIFDGVALTITNGTVNATEVMFFFTNSSTANSFDASGGQINLSAPTSGTYEGIAVYVDRGDTTNYSINISGGTGANVTGIIYAKNQDVSFTGQSGSDQSLYIIADKVEMAGGVTITNLNPDGSPIFYNAFLVQGNLVE